MIETIHKPVILVVGLGSIGKRHVKNLRALFPDAYMVVCRHAPTEHDQDFVTQYIDKVVYDLNEAIALKPMAAILCNPAVYHVSIALQLAKNDIHLFIEKPLSNTLTDVEALITLCRQKKLVFMVGYNLRFSKTLDRARELIKRGAIGDILSAQVNTGQYLPDWRPGADYRKTVSAQQKMGGGVLLELSHELDYMCWLLGKPVEVFARLTSSGSLEIDVEDNADVFLTFQKNLMVSIHLDMLQRTACRQCKVVGALGTIIWDGVEDKLIVQSEKQEFSQSFCGAEDKNEMYKREIKHFFDSIRKGSPAMVTGVDALESLKIVLAARKSNQTREIVPL
ncbi:MAG: Gfo/Idh/MocA family oxidoreductase [Pseudomonadota bacterium]